MVCHGCLLTSQIVPDPSTSGAVMQYVVNSGTTVSGSHQRPGSRSGSGYVLSSEVFIQGHPLSKRRRCGCGRPSRGLLSSIATRGHETSVYTRQHCNTDECVISYRVSLWSHLYELIPNWHEWYFVSFKSTQHGENCAAVRYALGASDCIGDLVQYRYSPDNLGSIMPFGHGMDPVRVVALLGAPDKDNVSDVVPQHSSSSIR